MSHHQDDPVSVVEPTCRLLGSPQEIDDPAEGWAFAAARAFVRSCRHICCVRKQLREKDSAPAGAEVRFSGATLDAEGETSVHDVLQIGNRSSFVWPIRQ